MLRFMIGRLFPAVLCLASLTAAAQDDRGHPSVSGAAARAQRAPLTAADLAGLRDIGAMTPGPGLTGFTFSPDRRRIAFHSQQADPATDSYHLQMMVMDVRPGAVPIVVDEGGELIRQVVINAGGVSQETGFPATVQPTWTRDGRAVLFLKRTDGSTQIWRALADGAHSEKLTAASGDVDTFVLSSDGRRLIYSSREPDPAAEAQLRAEGRRGYRYDARFMPVSASEPLASTSTRTISTLDLTSGSIITARKEEVAYFEKAKADAAAPPVALSPDGKSARVVGNSDAGPGAQTQLYGDDAGHHSHQCSRPSCTNAELVWWSPDGRRIRYMRREGWGKSETAIYEWEPGNNPPTRLYATDDLLLDCQPLDEKLLCFREQSLVPRQLVLLDPAAGHAELLYDPNPGFGAHALGQVERLHWRNSFGIETFGDLVYPVGYVPGRTYPLIVVQYISRGFLRGGVGDEFPIQLFANSGYAVLSVQRPSPDRFKPNARNYVELERAMIYDFKDRRSVLSSIERGVRLLVGRGIVDPARVGITGLSDGSSTVQFAALNSRMFKAGSVSGCCWDTEQDAFIGPAVAAAWHDIGWPPLIRRNAKFWSRMSLVNNAHRVAFPLLMQQADDEFRGALASYTALKQAGKPAALFVFPDEHHFKWHPAHRLAAYERNLRWFDFWLRGFGEGSEWGVAERRPIRLASGVIARSPSR